MLDLTCIAPTAASGLGLPPPRNAEGGALAQVVADLKGCDRLAIVVLDALGMATWRAARERMPTFKRMADRHLIQLRSVRPPVTPVCFATIATGARPETHGVRERTDAFKAETIFEVARKHGRTSGVAGGAGCSATMVLGRWSDVTRRVGSDGEERDGLILTASLRILAEDRPDLFFTQFVALDSASHRYGPFSSQAVAAAETLDARFGLLLSAACGKGYGVLALADHGQHPVLQADGKTKGWHDDTTEESMIIPLVWVAPGERTVAR
jgi:predicted AlkP superfamily pyrophosphatase or phosphodiesterase